METTYEIPSPGVLLLKKEDGTAETYKISERISTWQVVELSGLLADFTETSSDAGGAMMNAVLAFIQTGFDVKRAARALNDYEAAEGFSFGKSMTKGIVDVLRYIHKNNVIPRVQAILFLKPGETMVNDMEARVTLFQSAPISSLTGAVKDFFVKRIVPLKDTPSGLQIYAILKNLTSQTKLTSESASNMESLKSDGMLDSSTSLQAETSQGSEASSDPPSSEALSS